jgi:N-acetylmuramoyl-L-alanine amidase
MTLDIAVSAGHAGFGVTPGKRTPDGEYEWNFNDANADAFIQEISHYEDVRVKLVSDPTGRRDVPLRERVDIANDWGADLYLDFHHNAFTGDWHNGGGTETFSYPGSSGGKVLARVVHTGALDAYGLTNRGLKTMAFYVLRNTTMPAALIEGGFMDSRVDIKVMRNNKKLAELGVRVAQEVAKEYGLKRKKGVKSLTKKEAAFGRLYRVQVGAFSKIGNAAAFAEEVENKTGFDTYLVDAKVGNKRLTRVQVGAFSVKSNADKRLKDVKKHYKDAFITTNANHAHAIPEAEPYNDPADYTPKVNLAVDGYLGPNTVRALQRYFGTPVDVVISSQPRNRITRALPQAVVTYGTKGSLMISALQSKVGATRDGLFGPETARALQRYLGTPVDGVISSPSLVIMELQRRLNNGTF